MVKSADVLYDWKISTIPLMDVIHHLNTNDKNILVIIISSIIQR